MPAYTRIIYLAGSVCRLKRYLRSNKVRNHKFLENQQRAYARLQGGSELFGILTHVRVLYRPTLHILEI